ncbi:hypothetical protein [Streptomyces broussonetiae]|uniref:hypothetical protein n=1 Tax=Streptomyces broussonetiae TaxID=2686304 RepID=UPI002D7EDB58|nr:hypothetical protein [Streptomyces broussonetiae]
MDVTGGRDLRALFSTNDRTVTAEEAFTNRQAQWDLVADALAEHPRRISSPAFDVEDLDASRNNVIVLHGVGGIGKTTLSCKLEAALDDAGQRPSQRPVEVAHGEVLSQTVTPAAGARLLVRGVSLPVGTSFPCPRARHAAEAEVRDVGRAGELTNPS